MTYKYSRKQIMDWVNDQDWGLSLDWQKLIDLVETKSDTYKALEKISKDFDNKPFDRKTAVEYEPDKEKEYNYVHAGEPQKPVECKVTTTGGEEFTFYKTLPPTPPVELEKIEKIKQIDLGDVIKGIDPDEQPRELFNSLESKINELVDVINSINK